MNLKKLSLLLLAATTGLCLYAVPAKPGLRTFTQPDGTTVKLRLVGDEANHQYVTEAGVAVARDAEGYFRPVSAEECNAAKSRGIARRQAAETARKASQVPTINSPRIPVLLLQYSDYKFKDSNPNKTFVDFFEEGNTSARQYFVDQSNGKFTPEFDVYGPFTLSGKRTTYGGNDRDGNDKGVGKMVAEGCLGLDGQIDFSKYDNNGDGVCDVIIVLYAGDGEASSYDADAEDAVWPCQWTLAASDYGRNLTLDNTTLSEFAVFNELNGMNLSQIDGVGTFCHEFSHCLGLPDFYDTNYAGHYGMGYWSLMDSGCYNDDGYTPIGYSAYEKEFMGWISIPEATEHTNYTLPVLNQKSIDTDKAVRITNNADRNEYYIIENRAKQGWDKYMLAEGLMISHVTYSSSAWMNNTVNDYDLQRMTIIPADNDLKMDKQSYYGQTYYEVNEASCKGDLWPYGNANELTDTSIPKATVNKGGTMGKPVTEITRNNDGTISFWFCKSATPPVAMPLNHTHNIVSATSATISWQPGDNSNVTYTVEVSEHRDVTCELVMDVDFTVEHGDWTSAEYTICENGGTRLGSSSRTGSLTGPTFKADASGTVNVIVNAMSYNNDDATLMVSLLAADGTQIASHQEALGTSFADYTFTFKCTPDQDVKVQFASIAKKKRVVLHDAKIYVGDLAALAAPSRAAAPMVFSGITGTSHTVTGLDANGIYDYRVKAVPVDTQNFSESAWTDKKILDMTGSNGIGNIEAELDETPIYYNMQGIRVDNPGQGIYIRTRGGKAEKVMIK